MEFNAENVKAVTNTFTNLMSDVEQAEYYGKVSEELLKQSISNACNHNIYSDWIKAYLLEGKTTGIPKSLSHFLNAALRYLKSDKVVNLAHELDENYHGRIQSDLNEMAPRKSRLKWLITSGKKKNLAEEAFKDLSYLSESEYGPVAKGMSSTLNDKNQQSMSDAEIFAEINKNAAQYKDRLILDFSRETFAEPMVPVLSDIISKIQDISNKMKNADDIASICRGQISEAAEQTRQKQAYQALASIPIEELKRETSNGIRFKALKDHGYETVADVYSANVYQLSSINGISELGAREVKQAAKKYSDTVLRTTKFRLSADNRTNEATTLLKKVYQYKNYRPVLDMLNVMHKHDYNVERALNQLIKVGNGALWAFYNKSEKDDVSQAYNYLGSLLYGEYGRNAQQIVPLMEIQVTSDFVWDDFKNNPVSYINIVEDICPDLLGNGDTLYGLPENLATEIQDEAFFPDGLKCDLRPYQVMGVKYILHQKRVLLGDEMGLGKTIQAIATMVSLKNTGATHFVVVCPASVLTNWFKEIREKSKLRATIVHGAGKRNALKGWIESGGVAVTTYETTGAFELGEDFRYDMLVVDEAHYIKNTGAIRSQNVRLLAKKTDRLLFMSGTPLENKVDEMISLIEVLQPDIANRIRGMAFMSTAPQFRQAIAPVYYRRKRDNVLTELPEKEEIEEWCDLKPIEQQVYEKTVFSKNFMAMRRISWNVDDLNDSSKADHLKNLIDQATEEERKIIVFSFFRETISKIADSLESRCIGPITGSVSPAKRQELIDKFEAAPAGTVLLSQIQAGGTGLNIQTASVVIICEPQLKPSIENQAISRAYRMGQTRNVMVYRLLCSNSVDERMVERLQEKQREFDAFADKSVAAMKQDKEIDNNSINEIIQEEIDRINKEKATA